MSQAMRFQAVLVLVAVLFADATSLQPEKKSSICPTGFANFGDSLTDTGNSLDAFPLFQNVENPPYGESFFGAPAKRYSDGRLVPDFFSQAFRVPLLDAYFAVTSFNYKKGINFANAGATAALFNPPLVTPLSVTPFQTSQFIRFQNSVIATKAQPGCSNFNKYLPNNSTFPSWLYTITAGTNDILIPLENGVALALVNDTVVPQTVGAVAAAVTTLYGRGARRFLIFGVPASGCQPPILTYLPNLPRDNLGCTIAVNSIIQEYNALLLGRIRALRTSLQGSSIAFFDYYGASINITTSPATYGFNATTRFQTCCGAPGNGTFNYNPAITCGDASGGSNVCANPDQYINWDGIHRTEAFYRVIASFALNGQFTDGGVNYTASCNLDFSKFGNVTFQQAYPLQTCNNLFT